jgi:hypothetical protein
MKNIILVLADPNDPHLAVLENLRAGAISSLEPIRQITLDLEAKEQRLNRIASEATSTKATESLESQLRLSSVSRSDLVMRPRLPCPLPHRNVRT